MTTTISGEISVIRFRNSENWSVFSVRDMSTAHITNCTGTLAAMIDVGTEVTATGTMEDSKYGRQLKCEKIVPAAPDVSTDSGVVKLLQRLPGIGPKKAMQAVMEYGHEQAWQLACTAPEKIGVRPEYTKGALAISATLLESYEATVYLLSIGLTDHQAAVIYREYQERTIEIVSENPYLMTEIDGFGFLTVDRIALKAGMSISNQSRIAACILYTLDDAASNGGNIWLNGWTLVDIVKETLTSTAIKAEVSMIDAPGDDDVRKIVHYLSAENKLFISKGRVFSNQLLQAEKKISAFVGV